MTPVRPTQLAFKGRVEASALLLDDSAEGRRRVLRAWRPGATVRHTPRGLLLTLAEPERLRADAAPGAPLVAQHGVFSAVPLSKTEAAAFSPGSVLLAQAGTLAVLAAASDPLDPSGWLDLGGFTVTSAAPLPEPTRRIPAIAEPPPLDLHAQVKDPKTAQALLDALRDSGAVKPPSAWRRALRWFGRRLRGTEAPPSSRPDALDRLNAWLSRRLERSRLGRWLIDRQSAYFDRLLKMFDQDDLDEALRHAIALEGDALGPATGRALGTPSPRAGLGLTFGAGRGAGAAIQLEGNRYERLRAQYRAAAKKLEEAGRIDEAAFVLTDLLNAPLDAVALFERHQRWAVAARLAEGKGLDPALVVRLWFLAGDAARAVRVARKAKVFAPAVTRLEATHPAEARRLRMLWADGLAAGGDFPAAVRAAWPVPEARPLLLRWIDLGVEAGGPEGARLLLQRLELDPANAAPVVTRVLALLDDPSRARADEREAIAEALIAGPPASEPHRRLLVRPAGRALVRDRGAHGLKNEALLRRLLALDEGALRTDVPLNVTPPPPRQRPTDFVFRADPAALVSSDAAVLPGGRMLVALAESGVAVVAPDGRRAWHADGPAFSLAIAPTAQFAVTWTPRGEAVNAARLQLGLKTHADWGRFPLLAAAPEVHGGIWLVGSGHAVLALDALADEPTALWQYPLAGDRLLAIAADPLGHALLLQQATGVRLFQLLAPRHQPQPIGPQWVVAGQVTAAAATLAGFVCVGTNFAGQPRAWVLWPGTQQIDERVLDGPPAGAPAMTSARVAVAAQSRGGVSVDVTPGTLRLRFEDCARVALRWQGDVLVCAADNGRVVAFDTAATAVVRQLSVKAGR